MFENVEVGDKVAMFERSNEQPVTVGIIYRVERRSVYTQKNDEFVDLKWCRNTGRQYLIKGVRTLGDSVHISDCPDDIKYINLQS